MSINSENSLKIDSAYREQQTDEAVFASFIKGDITALGILYDRYGLLVYRLIYRMLGNAQEAEDLTQEIFLSLQVKAKFDPQRGSFYTYLMMLTRSRTIDRLRSKRSQGGFWRNLSKLVTSMEQLESDNPLEIVAIKERAVLVKQALQYLSANQRQVLELSYYEGLSQTEIAQHLNIPLGTVKTHSRRGLLQLRKNLHNLVN
ncbi:MAG: sigma-70 family RNA polymerase sigma factor [Cyanobacteria bacterium P01_G01_bin.39]